MIRKAIMVFFILGATVSAVAVTAHYVLFEVWQLSKVRHFRVGVSLLAGLVATYPATAFIRGPLRRYRRRKRGLCVNCGYNLTGNVSGICPECGVHHATQRIRQARKS